ncbi:MAG: hypothetical protein KDD52_09555 [Bdellovibrionales bacterium]|nr:hypothetical protein [Bdellovibrionales bacterium]
MKVSNVPIFLLLHSQFRQDIRQLSFLASNFLFCSLVLFFCKVALDPALQSPSIYSGIFWLITLFSCQGLFIKKHSSHMENTDFYLLHTGIGSSALLISKILHALIHLILLQSFSILLFAVFFQAKLIFSSGLFFTIVFSDASIVCLATMLLIGLKGSNVGRELLLIFLYPLLTPIFLLAHIQTRNELAAVGSSDYLGFIAGIFFIFLSISLMLSPILMEE